MKGARQRFSLKHFKLKIIRRKPAKPRNPTLLRDYDRRASSFSRDTIGEAGSESGAMAVK